LPPGASGFSVTDTEPTEPIRARRVVAWGDGLRSPGVTRRLNSEFASRSRDTSAAPSARKVAVLTEREVVAVVGEGLSNEDIAGRLFVSPNAAKMHTSRAMIKLGARDRAQLVVFAYESGLVRPGWTS
jgi:DNA-binding NarL/FixJ family response regulator